MSEARSISTGYGNSAVRTASVKASTSRGGASSNLWMSSSGRQKPGRIHSSFSSPWASESRSSRYPRGHNISGGQPSPCEVPTTDRGRTTRFRRRAYATAKRIRHALRHGLETTRLTLVPRTVRPAGRCLREDPATVLAVQADQGNPATLPRCATGVRARQPAVRRGGP